MTLVHLLGWNRWFAGQLANRELTLANPVLLAFITHGVLVVMAALAIGWQRHFTGESKANAPSEDPLHRGLLEPLAVSGVLSTAVTVPCVVVVSTQTLGIHAAYAAGIAVTWAIAGLIVRMPSLIGAGHVAATVAIGFAVAALAAQQPWPDPALRDLRHVQWQVIVLGLWCALGAATCRVSRSRISPQLLRGILPPIDTVLNVLVVVLLGLGVIGCTPGVMVELGFIAPDLPIAQDPWHMAAYQDGSWLALASVALALVSGAGRRCHGVSHHRGRRGHGRGAFARIRRLGNGTSGSFRRAVDVCDLHAVLGGIGRGAQDTSSSGDIVCWGLIAMPPSRGEMRRGIWLW